jgi:hypothetical protein
MMRIIVFFETREKVAANSHEMLNGNVRSVWADFLEMKQTNGRQSCGNLLSRRFSRPKCGEAGKQLKNSCANLRIVDENIARGKQRWRTAQNWQRFS